MTTQRDIADDLDKNQHRHLSNKVLHAHPSPSFWSPPEALKWDTAQMKKIPAGGINLYLSIPLCLPTDPLHCGFCLFPTEDHSGKEATQSYLNHLRQEALLCQDISPDAYAESIYIGGGTPNLLQAEDCRQMLEISRLVIPNQAADIEKTVEGIPQLFDAIRHFKAHGLTVPALDERGWFNMKGSCLELNPVGSFHVPLIQSAFACARNQTLRRSMQLSAIPVVRQDASAQGHQLH